MNNPIIQSSAIQGSAIQGPVKDSLNLHEHRFENNVCILCNKIRVNITLSTTKQTNPYELEKKFLNYLVGNN
jgi:hypothetical protein